MIVALKQIIRTKKIMMAVVGNADIQDVVALQLAAEESLSYTILNSKTSQ